MDAKICDACGKTIPIQFYNRISLTKDAYYLGSDTEHYHLCSDCFEKILAEAHSYKISLKEVDQNGVVKEG